MMATHEVNSSVGGGGGGHTPDDEDTFERDLKEMLKDGPTLSDLSPTVLQSGHSASPTPGQTAPSAGGNTYAKPQSMPGDDPRPHTLPPTASHPQPPPNGSPAADHNPATTSIPLSSPDKNGHSSVQSGMHNGPAGGRPRSFPAAASTAAVSNKLDVLKSWSINTYKCTRQMIAEKLGKGSRTVDLELESQIEGLRDTQRKYTNILRLSRALTNHFYHVVQTQRALGEAFSDLSQKSPELQEEFTYNAETQKAVCKNGETLLGALNFFTSSVNTLCNKTMEDTIQTIKLYEQARVNYDAYRTDLEVLLGGNAISPTGANNSVEYDAYRTDLESLNLGPRDGSTAPRIDDAQKKFSAHKEKFDRLRADVAIKLKFLEENKVKVMHKQLLLLHNAVAAYFSGNQAALEATLKQFNIKLKPPNTEKPSWLEQ